MKKLEFVRSQSGRLAYAGHHGKSDRRIGATVIDGLKKVLLTPLKDADKKGLMVINTMTYYIATSVVYDLDTTKGLGEIVRNSDPEDVASALTIMGLNSEPLTLAAQQNPEKLVVLAPDEVNKDLEDAIWGDVMQDAPNHPTTPHSPAKPRVAPELKKQADLPLEVPQISEPAVQRRGVSDILAQEIDELLIPAKTLKREPETPVIATRDPVIAAKADANVTLETEPHADEGSENATNLDDRADKETEKAPDLDDESFSDILF